MYEEFSGMKLQCNILHPSEQKFVGKVFVHFAQHVKVEKNLLNLSITYL